MSSISFPHTQSNSHEDQFYQPSFDTSSFQMNPLSAHPPRTPKTSLHASSSQHFGSVYEDASEVVEEKITIDIEDADIEDESGNDDAKGVAKNVPRQEEIWRDIVVSSNGRDKAFKLIQYSIRLGLWFHFSLTSSKLLRRPSRPLWEQEVVKRLTSTAAGLSITRKLLLLFNWLQPLTQITAQQSVPFSSEVLVEKKKVNKPFLHTLLYAPPPVLLELVNAIADDLSTWSKLGLFGKKFGDRVGRLADWCWFLTTIVGLVENGVERQINEHLQSQAHSRLYKESMSGATAKSKPDGSKLDERELARLRKQEYWLQVTLAKLVMDLIFVSYEIFEINRAKDFIKASTGLASAILSTAKVYDRHKNALLKTMSLG